MIGHLRGRLLDLNGNVVMVECAGVGYVVSVSAYTLASLPAVDDEVTLLVHTQAQENKITLFGFGVRPERDLFDLLLKVKNVGPSSALGILSGGAGPADIARLIADGQVGALTKLKGIGKKTAEMIIVELRDKCELLLASWGADGMASRPATPENVSSSPLLDEVAGALTQMGWKANEAQKVVSELDVPVGATVEALLRDALRLMPR